MIAKNLPVSNKNVWIWSFLPTPIPFSSKPLQPSRTQFLIRMITSHHYYQCFSIFQMRLSSFNKFLFLNVIKKNVWFFNRFSAYSLLAIYNKDFKKYRTQIHCPKIIFAPKVKFWQILECNNSKENVFVRYTWCSNKFWVETLKKYQINESTILKIRQIEGRTTLTIFLLLWI